MTASAFIAVKERQFEKELLNDELHCFKDIGREGQHCWLREAWTLQPQRNYPQKVHVIERLRLVERRGVRAYEGGAGEGDVEYRIGYWTLGRIGARKNRWTWASTHF